MRRRFLAAGAGGVCLFCTMAASAVAAPDEETAPPPKIAVESIMHRDPVIPLTTERTVFSPKLARLWLLALERPEAELRRQAADTIAKAQAEGMPDLAEMAPPLMKVLGAKDEREDVRLAAARALVAIEAKQAADLLFEQSQGGALELAMLVEPALAGWRHEGARKHWLTLVAEPNTPRSRLLLAIQCLTTITESSCAPRLIELVRNTRLPPDIRLAAARAAGALTRPTPVGDARELVGMESALERLLGAELLAHAEGPEAEAVLLQLASDVDPAAAAIAWTRLLETNPDSLLSLASQTLRRGDAKLRRLAAEALVVRPSGERVTLLSPLLDDPHPDVRAYVRESLFALATENEAEFKGPAIEGAMKALLAPSPDRWRGHEQAALLLAALDHKPAATRLVEFLEAPRPEEFVTAAWALRQLAVPETWPAMLDRAQRMASQSGEPPNDQQISQIFQAFGQAKYAPGEPLMRTFVPKNMMLGLNSRVAAVWAIGHLYAGKPDPQTVQDFVGRINDIQPPLPELTPVRMMSAIGLGRMQAKSELELLRKFLKSDSVSNYVGYGCAWAIRELTGEPIEPLSVRDKSSADWFLRPLDP